jgi:hypothetical protein
MDQRDFNRQFYLRNKDNVKLATNQYYVRNKNNLKQSMREYYSLNKLALNRSMREHYIRSKQNPDLYSPRVNSLKSWKTPEDVREYFESVAKELLISDHTDWYRVSNAQISGYGGMHRDRLSCLISKDDTCI